ncbi:MAG: B12-binding domain-containing radical SAM protein [Nitrospirae bacterium]|nr:B12-binding domain-containing radical SAM protein [Nitrospirota bacterium]
MPKALLVYPGNKTIGFTYPMGLLYLAKSLIGAGIDVSIFHTGIDDIRKLKFEDYLFVGISMLTGKIISNGLHIARLIKKYNERIPVVIGGVHPSLLPRESLENELIDIVVIGEGDKTIEELALCLMNGQALSGIKGIGYKDKAKGVTINQPRELIDMDELDFDLPYELLGKGFFNAGVMPVHTSRGCPYRCGFCYNPAFNKRRYRRKSADRVVAEIEYLKDKYKVNNFGFDFEDEFFIDAKRAYEIFQSIIRKGLKIRWTAFCRFNTFDNAFNRFGSDFVDVLKRSGCHYLSFGAESGSQRLLDEVIQKDIEVEQIFRTVQRLKTAGIPHRVSFMCCFPTETDADLNATFTLINRISHNNPLIVLGLFKLVPLPGTRIYDLLKNQYDYKTPSSLEGWGNYEIPSTSFKDVTWLSRGYTKKCYNISLSANYPFYKDFKSYRAYKKFVYGIDSTYGTSYPDYIMARLQRWRYKKGFFRFMVEPVVFNRYIKIRMFLINYLLKRYLPERVYKTLKKWFGKNIGANPCH